MSKRVLIPLLTVFLVVGFIAGLFYGRSQISLSSLISGQGYSTQKPANLSFDLFWNVWDILHSRYVDRGKINDNDLIYSAIDGLVKGVGDPYTVFFKPKESKQFAEQINGSFGGIGIEIGLRNEMITVIAPVKNTPAWRAGLLAGDVIVKINDKSTVDMKIDEAVGLIRGAKGTSVRLTYSREGGPKDGKEISIVRDIIKVPTVELTIKDDHIAYLQLYIFNKNVDDDFKKAARQIIDSKADRIVLDLRNNPGGLLDSAVNIAGYFLGSNQPVTIERFGDGREDVYKTEPNGLLKNYPLVILINKGSASASEILAGALKDNRGVPLIGETSFGKGSVQEILDLSDKSSVKVTIAKWFTPKGKSISDHGIAPDFQVKMTEQDMSANKDPQLDKAMDIIKNLK